MKKPKIIHIHVSVAPDMFHNTVGKPDLSKLKVEYPIPIELQENRRVECRIPISVPYLNDID